MKYCKCGKEMSFENTTGRGHDIGLCEECEWKKSADLPKADAYSLLDEVLERVGKWLMINSNIDVEKIVDMKIEVQKHFV